MDIKPTHPLIQPRDEAMQKCCCDDAEVKAMAEIIRRGLKMIIADIDVRYGESRRDRDRREREGRAA